MMDMDMDGETGGTGTVLQFASSRIIRHTEAGKEENADRMTMTMRKD
eukprot:CAMPEP_0204633860 /NCGR_PEP_ID=MMETSP0717-20131115/28128_1 /ASSEMBLY_ACC=CAM_ASM_000666 /TAXON_ID=230516 /ORGANISM="Chaetoceros curvisetus" /LENGTH=46 /DNA_ID= /DNA_START= /DNA_END= /DNA_ORIENTATION=